MENISNDIKKAIELMGLPEPQITIDEEHKKISLLIDDRVVYNNLPLFLPALEHYVSLLLRKNQHPMFVVDVNYYRKERERIISDLARAAAKKAMITKTNVELPPMNGYERRLVHVEITLHPELVTESTGIGKERRVVIKRI
jgi:predicted RNA-binding protein Jag